MKKSAVISDCEKYRYQLLRQWDESTDLVLFIGLNPSTADAELDDPIHRHTGGLEKFLKLFQCLLVIHRHTGGLEIVQHAGEWFF